MLTVFVVCTCACVYTVVRKIFIANQRPLMNTSFTQMLLYQVLYHLATVMVLNKNDSTQIFSTFLYLTIHRI